MRARALCVALLPVLALTGCPKEENEDPLTLGEAIEALDESTLSSQAVSLVNGTVEISTEFTIGQAVESAAAELRDFITQQLPCAEITLEKATLSIEYGAKPGNCTYNGNTYAGTHSVTVAANEDGNVEVTHTWESLTNTIVSVSGSAVVTWSFKEGSRNVVHDLTWTRVKDGRQGTGSGNRTQSALNGNILTGIKIDGVRAWEGKSGRWETAINNVEMRWVDPVPQSGSYTLSTPFSKALSMAFDRLDEDSIKVTLSSGEKSFSFNVNKAGAATQD